MSGATGDQSAFMVQYAGRRRKSLTALQDRGQGQVQGRGPRHPAAIARQAKDPGRKHKNRKGKA